MGETAKGHKRRRVFLEDVRGNGTYLRATWHPERRTFVVSTWVGEVCTGAVRLPAADATELVGLVVDGLSELAVPAAEAADAVSGPSADRGADRGPGRPDPRRALRVLRRWLRVRTAVSTPALPLRRSA
jgi:hypothetical protein